MRKKRPYRKAYQQAYRDNPNNKQIAKEYREDPTHKEKAKAYQKAYREDPISKTKRNAWAREYRKLSYVKAWSKAYNHWYYAQPENKKRHAELQRLNRRRKVMSETKKWNDYVIDAEGDPNPDGSGEVDIVEQGFACPDCGSLLPPLSDQGIAGCSNCLAIWRRDGEDLIGVDEDDLVAPKIDNL